MMGSPPGEKGRSPNETYHQEEITKAYSIQLTPVTQCQWALIMGTNPSYFRRADDADDDHIHIVTGKYSAEVNCDHPVEDVSWNDVQKYIAQLNQADGACTYRLPTDAEWEAAARAKTTTPYFFGNDPALLYYFAWHLGNSSGRTHAVAKKAANPDGLYDMYGNVGQLVVPPALDLEKGTLVVIRGGAYDRTFQEMRSTSRYPWDMTDSRGSRSPMAGFRLVRDCP
jgi:formylglycine-generating enzyme required for sulfatase activity